MKKKFEHAQVPCIFVSKKYIYSQFFLNENTPKKSHIIYFLELSRYES